MSHSLAWPDDSAPILILLLASACYVAFHYGCHADRWRARGVEEAPAVYRQRVGGFLLLGLLPALASLALPYPPAQLGFGLAKPGVAALFVLGMMALLTPILFAASRKPNFTEHYPQIRSAPWTRELYLGNWATWTLYLLAYEFFFRGFLLFPLAQWVGPWGAIAITTIAYVYAHLPKNADETIGTIPMGVIFAAAALYTGGFWAPFVLHVLIANTSETLAARKRSAEATP